MNGHRHRARRGYTLVFFAMFLFGFMALAALVIDVGFARLTQRQMQTAVDAAALEGLRFRDEVPDWLVNKMLKADVNPDDAENPDYARRWWASRIVAWTFDDNLNPDDGDQIGFGAGPVIGLGPPIPGAEDLNAGQLLTLPDTPFYKPVLRLNRNDERHGDMVAGRYTAGVGHNEYANYERDDFEPAVARNAFLVRMRRSNDFQDLDNQPDVSSHELPIPFLFGRGAFFPAGSSNHADGYSPRHHGMTVRATGIADARPAVAVGVARSRVLGDEFDLLGAVLLAVRSTVWNSLPRDESVVLDVDGNDVGSLAVTLHYIGQEVALSNQPISAKGYLPIFHEVNRMDRVVGFGFADVVLESATEVRLTKLVTESSLGAIAPENASARLSNAWEVLETLTEVELDTVLDLNLNSANPTPTAPPNFVHPLLSPVSVR